MNKSIEYKGINIEIIENVFGSPNFSRYLTFILTGQNGDKILFDRPDFVVSSYPISQRNSLIQDAHKVIDMIQSGSITTQVQK